MTMINGKLNRPRNIDHWPTYRGQPRGRFGKEVSLTRLTSPSFELKEKFKCILHTGKFKVRIKTSPWMLPNFSLLESSRLSPAHIYFKGSIFMSHWSIILRTTFLHQIVFKIWSKITGVTDLHILDEVNLCVTLIQYTNYDDGLNNIYWFPGNTEYKIMYNGI